ncbi:MAG TPA: hypothetical protein VFU88_12335 [Ktedonobacterales bacterium]|nr:hypothetical protein [Ktedonobacterales bacterium]
MPATLSQKVPPMSAPPLPERPAALMTPPVGAHEAALSAPRLTALDGAFLAQLALLVGCHIIAARYTLGWPSAAATDLLALLVLAAMTVRREWRPLLARLFVLGLAAGILELATDAAGEQVAHSLRYPAGEPLLWGSPYYMPLSWAIVLTLLGYLAWRLRSLGPARMPLWLAVVLAGIFGALMVPFYEEMAYYARWWQYTPVWRIGHTPVYVIVFEGLVAAALPLLVAGLLARPLRAAMMRGLLVGCWMPVAAFLAWFAIGR